MRNVHARHISAMLALLESRTGVPVLPPQISAGLCHGLVALGEEPPGGSCPYCYALVARAKEEEIGGKMKSICYRCKKVLATKLKEEPVIVKEKEEEKKSLAVKLEVEEQQGEKRAKKKRKKELNAGLILPPSKKTAASQSLPKTCKIESHKVCSTF